MRDLAEVIDEILAVEELPEELNAPLEDIKSSVNFAASWGQHIFWQLTAENLQGVLGKVDCEWKHRIHSIFIGEENGKEEKCETTSKVKEKEDNKKD